MVLLKDSSLLRKLEISFSERIWGKHRLELTKYLDTELTQSIIRGEDPQKLINKIYKKFNTTKRRAGNVVMTESAYFASVAQEECYKDLDVDRYEIVATLDTKTSKICQDMDGEVFDMNEYEPWVTAPPFHNFCRSVTAPYFEDFTEGSKRWYRDVDGNTGYVDADMKYNEWYDKYIEKSMEEEYTEIEIDLDDEQNIGSGAYEIYENSKGDIVEDGSTIIKAKKLKNTPIDAYISEEVEYMKGDFVHDYLRYFMRSAKKLNLDKNEIPKIYFCSNKNFSSYKTYAAYNARNNILRVNTDMNFSLQKRLIKLDLFGERDSKRRYTKKDKSDIKNGIKRELFLTCIHELVHYIDAKEYRKEYGIKGQMTKEQSKEWKQWCRSKAKEFIDDSKLTEEEINNISTYAKLKYRDGHFEEVYAEYIAKEIVGGKKCVILYQKKKSKN